MLSEGATVGIKFTISKKVQDVLGVKVSNGKIVKDYSKLVPEVRKEFRATGIKPVRQAILRDMNKGISPVDGQGKFEKYSESYKAVISGKGSFRKVGGKVIFIEGLRDEALLSAASPAKKKSPVTLRLTGQLHNALKMYTSGGFTEKFRLVFDWRDFLADIHNRRGAGKKKVVRRMLPTESGEDFNREISNTIITRLKKAANKIANRFS